MPHFSVFFVGAHTYTKNRPLLLVRLPDMQRDPDQPLLVVALEIPPQNLPGKSQPVLCLLTCQVATRGGAPPPPPPCLMNPLGGICTVQFATCYSKCMISKPHANGRPRSYRPGCHFGVHWAHGERSVGRWSDAAVSPGRAPPAPCPVLCRGMTGVVAQ